jgi:hypothetical protein
MVGLALAVLCVFMAGVAQPAEAALFFPPAGEVKAPEGQPAFGSLPPESVAVDDANGHVLVADSRIGVVYDFSSKSDTSPATWVGANTPSGSFGGGFVSVAADNETGDVYVADTTHEVVDKFDASGALIESFGDTNPTPNGQLAGSEAPTGSFFHPTSNTPLGIAVDQSTHALYVIDSGHDVIDVFDSSGTYLRQIVETPVGLYGCEGAYTDGIAVNSSTGHVYVSDSCSIEAFEFDASGTFVRTFDGSTTPAGSFGGGFTSVAADSSSGRVYIVDTSHELVDAFNGEAEYLGQITGRPAGGDSGVAVDQADGSIYVSNNSAEAVQIFEAPLALPDIATLAVAARSVTSATLAGTVNPAGAGAAKCKFVWGVGTELTNSAPCPGEIENGSSTVEVQAELTGLTQDTEYCYRLQASNANGTNSGFPSENQCFRTLGPGIDATFATAVTADSATLHAAIDANGAQTGYYFQFGETPAYGQTQPAALLSIGAGSGDVEVTQHLQGLRANTTYHYRVVAISEVSPGHNTEFDGPDEVFTTQPAAVGAPTDGRAWELVSPADKPAASVSSVGAGDIQAADDGKGMTYLVNGAPEESPSGNSNESQVLSVRTSGGWVSSDIATPHLKAPGKPVGFGEEYRYFGEDLARAIVQPVGELYPGLSDEASEMTPFLREGVEPSREAVCSGSCFRPLVTGKPGFANVPEGTSFGPSNCPRKPVCGPEFVGASPDARHVVVESSVPLTTGSNGGLYEWTNGVLAFVGEANEGNPYQGISDDGSLVVFKHRFEGTEEGLILSDTADGQSIRLDAVQGAGSPGVHSHAVLQLIGADGSRIYFTDPRRLTADANASEERPDLYECKIERVPGHLACSLSDVTTQGLGGEAAAIVGSILGGSRDGTVVYFAANGRLAPNAVEGACSEAPPHLASQRCNVYMLREGQAPRLIGQLSGLDFADWFTAHNIHTARVSGNGEWAAFMSQASLTGYDNRDAVSGVPDEEVFLYGSASNRTVCASCDPTGARPHGVEFAAIATGLAGGGEIWEADRWVAANVPGWIAYATGKAVYQSRYLSDSGRLYFNSRGPLVPQDTNGAEDVYEYEPASVGGCAESSEGFLRRSLGCIGLISSGQGGEAAFLDASASGGDAFFVTGNRLAAGDIDSSIDLYDARECTSAAPCLSPSTSTPSPPCASNGECRGGATGGSAASSGGITETAPSEGNASPSPASGVRRLTRQQLLAQALKRCNAKHNRKLRKRCIAAARSRYGPKAPPKKKKHKAVAKRRAVKGNRVR